MPRNKVETLATLARQRLSRNRPHVINLSLPRTMIDKDQIHEYAKRMWTKALINAPETYPKRDLDGSPCGYCVIPTPQNSDHWIEIAEHYTLPKVDEEPNDALERRSNIKLVRG